MIHTSAHRSAFSMITAIFMILILATIGGFIMNLSGKIIQETTIQYRKEQAILYAKSYTEFAIMAASSTQCTKKITAYLDGTPSEVKAGKGYYVVVYMYYIGKLDPPSAKPCTNRLHRSSILGDISARNNIIVINTYVHYRDPDSIEAKAKVPWGTNSGITYFRRTTQRL